MTKDEYKKLAKPFVDDVLPLIGKILSKQMTAILEELHAQVAAAPPPDTQRPAVTESDMDDLLVALNVAASWLPGYSPDADEAAELQFVASVLKKYSSAIKLAVENHKP